MEEGIEIGEVLAERLDNFITLVPQRKPEESAEKEAGLESIITELATRWSRLVEWVNTRYAKLQNALLHWRHFEEEANVLSDWLTERAEEVGRVTAAHNKFGTQSAYTERGPNSGTASLRSLEHLSTSKPGGREADSDRSSPSNDQSMTNESIQKLLEDNEAEMDAIDVRNDSFFS